MPLKDLIIKEEDVGEELLEEILRGYANLATDTRRVILTAAGRRLPARVRILLVLSGRHAWRFVAPGEERTTAMTVKEIQEQTGLPGNTLRPALKALKDAHVIEAVGTGEYTLPAYGLQQAKDEITKLRA